MDDGKKIVNNNKKIAQNQQHTANTGIKTNKVENVKEVLEIRSI